MLVYYYKCMKYFSAPCSLLNSAIIVPGLLEKEEKDEQVCVGGASTLGLSGTSQAFSA